MLFLQDHKKDDIVIGTKTWVRDEKVEGKVVTNTYVEALAQFVNKDDEVTEETIIEVPIDEFEEYAFEVKTYSNRPFSYIEVRRGGLLEEVLKVDRFLSRLWNQELSLYVDAYNVQYNVGGRNDTKRNTRKVDDES